MRKSIFGYAIVAALCLSGLFYHSVVTYQAALMQSKTALRQEQEKPKHKHLNKDVIELLEIVKKRNLVTENPTKLAEAIQALGERQIEEAVPDLIGYLNFRRIHSWEGTGVRLHPIPKEGDYPAVGALFSIGKPSLTPLIKVVEENEIDSIESENAVRAIQLIFRDDLGEGVKYLENEMAKSTSSDGTKRLYYAVEKTRELQVKIQTTMPNNN